ncbi:hypothetical protein MIR68_004285 [Amoeboaphelidium protococcarum]|nr:hypothetical protein MIR68_004285 [Amoeboaphelidium protococcarum]
MQNPLLIQSTKTSFAGNQITASLEYPARLTMYKDAPSLEISLEEFELFAVDRLKVLLELESAVLRNRTDEQMRTLFRDHLKKLFPFSPNNAATLGVDVDEERRKDYISHFILRLSYSRTDEQRSWFMRNEAVLFKMRWEMLTDDERMQFVRENLDIARVPNQERSALQSSLSASVSSHSFGNLQQQQDGSNLKAEVYYQVPFEKVCDLVGRREVFLRNGFAYVRKSQIFSIVLSEFKQHLQEQLLVCSRLLPRVEQDERLKPLLVGLSKQSLDSGYNSASGSLQQRGEDIKWDQVGDYVQHFPPCMKVLHQSLRENSHLKHQGRQQLSLFLKGIGLPLEDALIFWQKAFSKKYNEEQFKRQYAYNIRHNYGKEGKRADYTPFSCMKIITQNAPSNGEVHGCPFKHYNKDSLTGLMRGYGLKDADAREVVNLAKNGGHCQVACTKYFEISRGIVPSQSQSSKNQPQVSQSEGQFKNDTQHNVMDTIAHPNQFFDLSLKQAVGKSTTVNSQSQSSQGISAGDEAEQ